MKFLCFHVSPICARAIRTLTHANINAHTIFSTIQINISVNNKNKEATVTNKRLHGNHTCIQSNALLLLSVEKS